MGLFRSAAGIAGVVLSLLFAAGGGDYMAGKQAISGGDVPSDDPQKWALIVAIGEYPESGGWTQISSANDIPLIQGSLVSQGFPEENILVIRDGEATKTGIIEALNTHLLENVSEGDIAFVHFSSHGQQIFDDNGDEIDGYDEAIVPYNAGVSYEEGVYEGEHHFRDDELGEIFDRIRERLGSGGSMLSVVDACHSGTATRGFARARGSKTLMEPADYVPPPAVKGAEQAFFGVSPDTDLAPMVVISGASASELNYEVQDAEGNGMGSLSYTFSKVLSEADGPLSYRELFERIRLEMNRLVPHQTPQIEGDVDRQVLGGAVLKQDPWFLPELWYNQMSLQVKAGTIHGFTDHSTVHLYDMEVQDFDEAEPLATGKVMNATAIDSDIEITEMHSPIEDEEVKVVLHEQSYEGLTVKVQMEWPHKEGFYDLEQITEHLVESGVVEMVEEGADLVLVDEEGSRGNQDYHIMTPHDRILFTGDLGNGPEADAGVIVNEIKKYAKVKFLRNLELESDELDLELQVIPFSYTASGRQIEITETFDFDDFLTESGTVELAEGQAFKLKIVNRGSVTAYFTVVDFTPSGEAMLVVPYGNRTPGDFVLDPGQEIELSDNLLQITPPYGNEMLKLFATEEPLDLRPILDVISRGNRAGTPRGPFQMLLEDASEATRSGPLGVPPSAANIHSVTFKVIPR